MDQSASTRPFLGQPLVWETSPALVEYPAAIAAMQAHIAGLAAGLVPERVWLVEHPPLYTAGTSARAADLQAPGRFPVFDAGRGGQWTYHGPGQRVAYVMLGLTRPHGSVRARDLHAYVAGLEAWLIGALALLGVVGGAAGRSRRHLGGRSGERGGEQDRGDRRAGDPLGVVAWGVAKR